MAQSGTGEFPEKPSEFDLGFKSTDGKSSKDAGKKTWIDKCKENPMLPTGILGGLAALGYSIYNYRHRDKSQKLSIYLIHTRMAAQGCVVGALAIGVMYKLITEHLMPELKGTNTNSSITDKIVEKNKNKT